MRTTPRLSKYFSLEIDLFEYFPDTQREIAHRFFNYASTAYYTNTEPVATSKWTRFCDLTEDSDDQLDFFTPSDCEERDHITVTKGLEWTPRGYRWFVKVEGVHDDFIVVRDESTVIRISPVSSYSDPVTFGGLEKVEGAARNKYVEFEDAADPETVIEKVAVSHRPLQFGMVAWSDAGNTLTENENTIITKMRIDYVRVFQPRNRYADMEPVFQ